MSAIDLLNEQFVAMRAHTVSLAADLDRLQRCDGKDQLRLDPRMLRLCAAIEILSDDRPEHARRILEVLSDPME